MEYFLSAVNVIFRYFQITIESDWQRTLLIILHTPIKALRKRRMGYRLSDSLRVESLLHSGATECEGYGIICQIDGIDLAYPFYGNLRMRNELWVRGSMTWSRQECTVWRWMGIVAL